MKTKMFILVIISLVVNTTFSQFNITKFSAIAGLKNYSDIVIGNDSLTVSAIEIGFGMRGGKELNSKLISTSFFGFSGTKEVYRNWAYITPYATVEFNYAYSENNKKFFKLKDGGSSIVLNAGGSAGAGVNLFYFIPIGVCVSGGFSSDFKDVYLAYSYGICAYNLSVNFGGRTNLTKNNSSFYKSLNSIEIKYIYNLFKKD